MKYRFLQQLFIAVDQTANTLLGGWADETISARAYRRGAKAKEAGRWTVWRVLWHIIDTLFYPETAWLRYRNGFWPAIGHCQRAYVAEKTRSQLPPEYRDG